MLKQQRGHFGAQSGEASIVSAYISGLRPEFWGVALQLPADKSLSDIFWLLDKSWAASRVRAMELTAEVGRAKC